MNVARTWHIRQLLGSMGYGFACVEYAGYGVSSGWPSEYGCYRSADAAVAYLQQQALTTLDQVTLIGWFTSRRLVSARRSDADHRRRATRVPWRRENCGHRQSFKNNENNP
jgi:hypothetical protein